MGGCFSGSLATSTGPRSGGEWSIARHQAAHVGETVRFSFILTRPFKKHPVNPAGIADYCIVTLDDWSADAELDATGKFPLAHRMPEAWRDREIRIVATAYRRYGRRDRMAVNGELLHVDNASDAPDKVIARRAITVLVYQSAIELTVAPGADDFNFGTGRLIMYKADGTASAVAMARPPVGGFTLEGPDENHTFTVRHEPKWDQVNTAGKTRADFTVYDLAGHQHRIETEFLTP